MSLVNPMAALTASQRGRASHLQATKRTDEDESKAKSKSNEQEQQAQNVDPLTKASWYAVEAFGKAFGGTNKSNGGNGSEGGDDSKAEALDLTRPPRSLSETMKRLELDTVDRSYFVSGDVDAMIYDVDCVFADPFASFAGRDRFVDNLSNLGSFVTKYDTRMISYDTSGAEGVVVEGEGKGSAIVRSKVCLLRVLRRFDVLGNLLEAN